LFFSHDGFGLGHVRRNSVIARALLEAEPLATATIVTGVTASPPWLGGPRTSIVRVPPLMKTSSSGYKATGLSFERAVQLRAKVFLDVVRASRPDVVIIDRHPYGTAGELRPGLWEAAGGGAALVLGLRDVLDEPEVVAAELAGPGWAGVSGLFDEVLVYGSSAFCDQQKEYGLPVTPTYCGWVVGPSRPARVDPRLLVVGAGGGGDGAELFQLGLAALEELDAWEGVFACGPYADAITLVRLATHSSARRRLAIRRNVAECSQLFAGAGAVIQMAGYNSTIEALAAGCRPILVPRRRPRREQLIRAQRLAQLDLVDVLREDAGPADVMALLGKPRRLEREALKRARIGCDGARRAASILVDLAGGPSARSTAPMEVAG
jgi:predicted glycosyltransferase